MKTARTAVMAAAILALAGLSAHAQEFFQAKVKGTVYEDGSTKVDKVKFGNDTVLDAFAVPNGDMAIFWDGDAFDEEVFAVDSNGDFAGWLMYALDDSCAEGVKSSSSKDTTKLECVELISLFDGGNIDGSAQCSITETIDSNKDTVKLNKKCHVQAIVPSSEDSDAPATIAGWPIEFDVTGGKALDISPF